LFRAQEDGYLDMRLQRGFPPEFFKLFTEMAAKAEATGMPDEVKEKIYQSKTLILDALDLKHHRRLYRYLVQVVRQLYPERLTGTGGGTGVDWNYFNETTERLNLLKKLLYEQDELIAQQERSQAKVFEGELAEIKAQLRELLEKLRAGTTTQDALMLLGGFAKKLEATEFLRRRIEFLNRLRSTVFYRLKTEYSELLKEWEKRKSELSETRSFEQRISEGYWSLRDALDTFHLRDMIIYPMVSGDEPADELQQIHFARISPADADQYIPGLSAKDKIAGEQFAHFGGFLSEEWRGNDLTWGRLDAAEIIFRKLMSDGADRETLIAEAHHEIISEMNSLDMGIYAQPRSAAVPTQTQLPRREDLIGKQDLSAISADKKINWSWRGAITVLKIVRQTLAETKAAFLLRGLLGFLDKVTLVMTGIFAFFAWVVAKLFRWRVLLWLLLASSVWEFSCISHGNIPSASYGTNYSRLLSAQNSDRR